MSVISEEDALCSEDSDEEHLGDKWSVLPLFLLSRCLLSFAVTCESFILVSSSFSSNDRLSPRVVVSGTS